MSALAPWLLSVLRIVTALLDIPHGTSKIFGFPRAGSGATVELYSLLGLAGSLEMVGGALILWIVNMALRNEVSTLLARGIASLEVFAA